MELGDAAPESKGLLELEGVTGFGRGARTGRGSRIDDGAIAKGAFHTHVKRLLFPERPP